LDAFADYAAFSNIRQMFGVQVQNLNFIGWFYRKQIFIYIFMAFALITTIYLFCKPRDTSVDSLALKDRLKRRLGAGHGPAAESMASSGRNRAPAASQQSMASNSNNKSDSRRGSDWTSSEF
jgi:hypothetical protein